MEWKGKNLKNNGELLNAAVQCSSRQEAKAFLALWEVENPQARESLGYLSGYLSEKTRDRVNDWFGVEHPMWGRRQPSQDEQLVKGMLIGLKLRYPENTEIPVAERIVWRIIEETASQTESRKLLLEQLLQACYLVTRSLGGKNKFLPQMGEQKTREFVDMVLFVRKLLGDEEPMFQEPERMPDEQEYS